MAVRPGVFMVTLKCGAHSKDVPGSRRLVEMTLKRNWSLSHEASTKRKWTFISVSFKDLPEQLPPALSFSPWDRVSAMSCPEGSLAEAVNRMTSVESRTKFSPNLVSFCWSILFTLVLRWKHLVKKTFGSGSSNLGSLHDSLGHPVLFFNTSHVLYVSMYCV